MFRRTFKVVYRPMKNNFVLLPENYYKLVSTYDSGCLSITYGKNCHYTTWVPYAGGNIKETELGMNAKVAKDIGLKEDDLVKCALVTDIINLKSVFVTPVTPKDWEIIELSSERIQSTLLDQTRIVNSAQILIIWINKSMPVSVTVDRLKPNFSYGRIDNETDLVIAPKLQLNGSIEPYSDELNAIVRSKTTADMLGFASPLTRSTTTNMKTLKDKSLVNKANRAEKLERIIKDLRKENSRVFEFRVISGKWEGSQICDIFITKSNLPEFLDLEQNYLIKAASEKEYYVNIKVVSDSDCLPNNIHPTVEINENLMKLLSIKELEKVTLRPKQTILNFLEKIELFAHKKTNYKIIEHSFKAYILENTKLFPLLLNQEQVVRLEDGLIVTVKITPEHFRYCLINAQILKECKLYAADEVIKVDEIMDVEQQDNESILSVADFIHIQNFDDIVQHLIEQIKMNLCLDQRNSVLRQGNVLIAGQSNSGKSVLVERILDALGQKPFYCFYDVFYCTRSKGRKAESIQKDLRQIFTTSLNNAPSIVVLENLDVLTHSSGDQQTQDGEYFNRISDTVQHLIVEYTTSNPISVIATVSSIQGLNKRIYSPRGRHLFHTIAKIPELGRDDREFILSELCSHISSSKLDLPKFSKLTEGYTIGDLVQFIERGIFYAYRINSKTPVLSDDLLTKSLENTNSYCLQGIETHRNGDQIEDYALTVEKIPGLENVVSVLEEVLMWPSKYPSIFDDSPLRNQAGVLLFGPPGTGKTFLVSQISHSWNLRTISVKGPELLAKYIGQSEENVRNLFNKARNAKPCVLFFDEFDSLAPRRGHDSTGVTDRVVNQLLTELDGVEGLQGVTVIAATSRPELLDPALLRSGRIDRMVECSLPDRNARLKIFEALSRSLHFDKSVNLNYFAEKTENYTGADIQSILTTANMTAVKEVLAKCKESELPDKINVGQSHLLEAFNNTRPSLSPSDLVRYQKTYARFTNKEKVSPKDFVAKRATLA